MAAAAGGSAKNYGRHLGTDDAGLSGCGALDGAGIPH